MFVPQPPRRAGGSSKGDWSPFEGAWHFRRNAMRLKWVQGFCPDFLRAATSRTQCLPLLKECKLRPRRGKNRFPSMRRFFTTEKGNLRSSAHSGHHARLCIGTVFGAVFAVFSPCVGFSAVGWDTYPTPEEKRAHRGDSGVYCFPQRGWYAFGKCVFSCKSKFRRRCNDFSYLPSDAFQLHIRGGKDTFQRQAAPAPRLSHRKRNRNFTVATTAFSLLPHLPHIIFTRIHPQSFLLCAYPNTSPAGIFH